MATYKGGEGGGQKSSKKWLHGFCMPPFYFYMQFVVPYTSAKNTIHYFIHLLTRRMLKTFLGIIILSSLIISNGNLCEAKWLRHQKLMVNNGKMEDCSVKCAPQTCRIKCVPTMATTTTTTTTITSTTTTITSTATTSTAMTSTTAKRAPAITNTKANYAENEEVILKFSFKMN